MPRCSPLLERLQLWPIFGQRNEVRYEISYGKCHRGGQRGLLPESPTFTPRLMAMIRSHMLHLLLGEVVQLAFESCKKKEPRHLRFDTTLRITHTF